VKDYLANLVRASRTPADGRNVVREYLQARILGSLQRSGAMVPLAFHGGTALRFLHALPRYSEDLDFALEHSKDQYDLRRYLRAIKRELVVEGYDVQFKISDRKVVHNAFVRFVGLLYELGLSPHRTEVIATKLEIDTNPPAGAVLATTLVRRHITVQLQHHDRASLLAGKLHAILQRPYLKGRDIYDLLWYLSDPDWPSPNLELLNNALQQTGWSKGPLSEDNWRVAVGDRLQNLDWARVRTDVGPFLGPEADISLLNQQNLMGLLIKRR
jgi:predicted nucleotidyltransferase component of viral defense system